MLRFRQHRTLLQQRTFSSNVLYSDDYPVSPKLSLQAFRKSSFYSPLNAEQRHIVEHKDGPLMVLAGPGTGKTHVLVCLLRAEQLNGETFVYS